MILMARDEMFSAAFEMFQTGSEVLSWWWLFEWAKEKE